MMAGFSRWLLSTTVGLGLLALTVSGASAASLLYDDFTSAGSTSRWSTALTQHFGGTAPQQVSDDAAFIAALSNPWDVVVVQFDSGSHNAMVGTALQAYIAAGGKVIFSNFNNQYDTVFGVTQASIFNTITPDIPGVGTVMLSLTVLDPFTTLLASNPILLECEGCYEVIARSFTGGTSAGTFDDLNSGIVIGIPGRTIVNGFQGETLPESDEIQLYRNELGYLVAVAQVPEPSTGLLLALGAAFMAAARHRRKR